MFQNDSDCAKPLIVAGKLNHRILVISVLSVLVLAAATAFIVSRIKPISRPRELILPDGTTVRIEALTFGKEHSYSTDPVRDKLRRWAPAPCRRFLGKGILSTKMLSDADSARHLDHAAGSHVRLRLPAR